MCKAVIELDGHRAVLREGEWHCDDDETRDLLNSHLRLMQERGEIHASYLPDPISSIAEVVARDLGAVIIEVTDPPPAPDSDGLAPVY
jgi:hypothetical protein